MSQQDVEEALKIKRDFKRKDFRHVTLKLGNVITVTVHANKAKDGWNKAQIGYERLLWMTSERMEDYVMVLQKAVEEAKKIDKETGATIDPSWV